MKLKVLVCPRCDGEQYFQPTSIDVFKCSCYYCGCLLIASRLDAKNGNYIIAPLQRNRPADGALPIVMPELIKSSEVEDYERFDDYKTADFKEFLKSCAEENADNWSQYTKPLPEEEELPERFEAAQINKRLNWLRARLEEAVEVENYDRAADFRDQIKRLEGFLKQLK